MEDKIVKIINEMAEYLNVAQMKKLQEVLLQTFSESEAQKEQISNEEYLKLFLDAKKIEGCSERTIQYYRGAAAANRGHAPTQDDHRRDPALSGGISEDQQLRQSDHRQCAPEYFQLFLVAGRRGLHPQKPHAPHP